MPHPSLRPVQHCDPQNSCTPNTPLGTTSSNAATCGLFTLQPETMDQRNTPLGKAGCHFRRCDPDTPLGKVGHHVQRCARTFGRDFVFLDFLALVWPVSALSPPAVFGVHRTSDASCGLWGFSPCNGLRTFTRDRPMCFGKKGGVDARIFELLSAAGCPGPGET